MSTIQQFNDEHGVRDDGQIHMSPINLDCVCEADLEVAQMHPALHESVRTYAFIKHGAVTFRKQGCIELALKLESKLERIYNNMPEKLRW